MIARHKPSSIPRHKHPKKDGRKLNGRQKGVTNKIPRGIKEAIALAMEELGRDGEGKEGTVGFFKNLWAEYPELFVRLVERILPLQVTGRDGGPIQTVSIPSEILKTMRTEQLEALAVVLDRLGGSRVMDQGGVIDVEALPGDAEAYAKDLGLLEYKPAA